MLGGGWGVALCCRCGATIVLGEARDGALSGLCAACQALPDTPAAPRRLRLDDAANRRVLQVASSDVEDVA